MARSTREFRRRAVRSAPVNCVRLIGRSAKPTSVRFSRGATGRLGSNSAVVHPKCRHCQQRLLPTNALVSERPQAVLAILRSTPDIDTAQGRHFKQSRCEGLRGPCGALPNRVARKRTECCRIRRQAETPKSEITSARIQSTRDQRVSTYCPVTHCAEAQRTGTRRADHYGVQVHLPLPSHS